MNAGFLVTECSACGSGGVVPLGMYEGDFPMDLPSWVWWFGHLCPDCGAEGDGVRSVEGPIDAHDLPAWAVDLLPWPGPPAA